MVKALKTAFNVAEERKKTSSEKNTLINIQSFFKEETYKS